MDKRERGGGVEQRVFMISRLLSGEAEEDSIQKWKETVDEIHWDATSLDLGSLDSRHGLFGMHSYRAVMHIKPIRPFRGSPAPAVPS